MSDPFRGQPPDKNEEKASEKTEQPDKSKEFSPINLEDAQIRRGTGQQKEQQKEQPDPSVDRSLAKIDLTFYAGANPGLQSAADRTRVPLRKSEDKPAESSARILPYKPLINDFLKTTDAYGDKKLNDAEQRQLKFSRESLSNAENVQDAVSDALHLARLYQHMRYIEEAKKAIAGKKK